MSSNLPPGVTDSMCEPNDPICARCGHTWSFHYEDEDKRVGEDGTVYCCDYAKKGGVPCTCDGFVEGEYTLDEDGDRLRGN